MYETVDNVRSPTRLPGSVFISARFQVESFVGGLAEDLYGESNFGELFYTSMADQYRRIRDGDRFYFENANNGLFTAEEINEIRRTGSTSRIASRLG